MSEHLARAYAACRNCPKEGYVQGVVGVSTGTPDGHGEAEFYPEIAGSVFDFCGTCKWPDLEWEDVQPKEGV